MTRRLTRPALAALAAAALLGWAVAASAAGLDVHASATRIAQGETFQLSLSGDSAALSAPPDISPLARDFDILGTSRSTQIRIVNGSRSDRVEWKVTLAPKAIGSFTIPVLSAGSASSDPLTIEVLDPSQMPQAVAPGAPRIEVSVPKGTHYVQQEIPLTLRISAGPDLQRADIVLPESTDYTLTQTGEDHVIQSPSRGDTATVVERTFLLRPQKSGTVTVPPISLRAVVRDPDARSPFAASPFADLFGGGGTSPFDQMIAPGKEMQAHTEALSIQVKAQPVTSADWFLPAKNVELEASWDPAQPQFRVGEAVTRKIRILALGATEVQLPDLNVGKVDGVRFYLDNSHAQSEDSPEGTAALREFTYSVVPMEGGDITLPEIRLDWFDTDTETEKVAVLPAEVIRVTGTLAPMPQATATAGVAAPTPDKKPEGLKALLAFAMQNRIPLTWTAAGLLAVAAGIWGASRLPFLRRGPRATGAPSVRMQRRAARRRVEAAVRGRDPRSVYPAAVVWLAAATGRETCSHQVIGAAFPDLLEPWRELEAHVFSDAEAGTWDGAAFLRRFRAADQIAERRSRTTSPRRPGLAPLYPVASRGPAPL